MAGERLEQVELAARELERLAAAGGDPARRVDAQVGEGEHRARGPRRAAAQQRVQPRDELLDRERLDEVVVGARLQPGDAVGDLVARGEDADRRVVARRAQPRRDGVPVDAGQDDVEDDRRRWLRRDRRQRRFAVGGRAHGEALEAQSALEGHADRGLVVDDEDEGRRRRGQGRAPAVSRAGRRPAAGVSGWFSGLPSAGRRCRACRR